MDLAVHCDISGIIFQDDGYLNDFEDFHPAAAVAYESVAGDRNVPFQKLSSEKQQRWTEKKTDTLIALTERIKRRVLYYRFNEIRFARIIYAPVITNPASEEWFAQNFEKCLDHYDEVVVMAYPRMEEVRRPQHWLTSLVKTVQRYPEGLEQTVFKVQSYDWEKRSWIADRRVVSCLEILLTAGARHVAYYPDDYIENRPDMKLISHLIGSRDFPYKE